MNTPMRWILTLAMLTLGTSVARGDEQMLTRFDGETSEPRWVTVNDNVMGGRSQGGFSVKDGTLVFSGSTNTNGGGFSSIRSRPESYDLGGQEGIRLRVKGDGRTYTFRLTTSDSATSRFRPSWWAEFATSADGSWQEVSIPFKSFVPRWRGRMLQDTKLNPKAIDSLGLMIYDRKDGAFRLEVDWIKAYGAKPSFSLAAYRNTHRPLLVFAESGDDPRLKRQLAEVKRSRADFEDRDMVLIVVLENGASKAGDQALTEEDAKALRSMLSVKPGAFAVHLVGKDGKVKKATRAVEPMALICGLIDQMPMRKAEMRR